MANILKQKVYHNGTSMVVLKPGDDHPVPDHLRQSWIDEGVIDKDDLSQLDHDGDGRPGGSLPKAQRGKKQTPPQDGEAGEHEDAPAT